MSKNKRLDALGDRLKTFERIETEARFPPNNYLYVRIDGRSFSKFTKGLTRPYDTRLSSLMQLVTASLVKEFNAVIGYTQSDEISLIINNTYEKSCIFEAKKQKLISTIASFTAAVFNAHLASVIPEKDPLVTGKYPSFDCRIFPVTTASEATNAILWREHDAIKNSVSMSAHHHFSHKELQGVNTAVMKDMLKTKASVIWEDYPKFFKSGSYFKRVVYNKVMTDGSLVPRSKVAEVDLTLSEIVDHDDRIKVALGE